MGAEGAKGGKVDRSKAVGPVAKSLTRGVGPVRCARICGSRIRGIPVLRGMLCGLISRGAM